MSQTVISIEHLSKRYLIGHQSARRARYTALRDVIGQEARNFVRKAADLFQGKQIVQGDEVEELWALRSVSFNVEKGQVVGIMGQNGAGKSTLLKILSRITAPTEGRVRLRDRVGSLLEVGTGFHPELTGRENIFLNGAILGMSHREIARKFDEIVAFAEIEKFLDTPVKHYSSGMYVRLAFAVAAHLDTGILIVDEVLAVGDFQFQQKCIGKMHDVSESGRTVLLVSHNMAALRSLASRCIVLANGMVVFDGKPNNAISWCTQVLNPNTQRATFGRGIHTAIRSIRLVDERGDVVAGYLPGTPLRVELIFFTDGSPSLSIEIFLVAADKQKVALLSLHQFHGITLPRESGTFRTIIDVEPMWIASGQYWLSVATSIVNVSWDHFVDDALSFDVESCNRGGQSWDFKQSYGYGAFSVAISTKPKFERQDLKAVETV